jgi:hypothetical protein
MEKRANSRNAMLRIKTEISSNMPNPPSEIMQTSFLFLP